MLVFVTLVAAAVPKLSLSQPLSLPLGAVNVARYSKFETSFTLPGQTGNPYDPADNDVEAEFAGPHHMVSTVPAFWDGDRWSVRFSPTQVGLYKLALSRNGTSVRPQDLGTDHFTCVDSTDPGFVRKSQTIVQKFVFDDGSPYLPMGIDAAWVNSGQMDYPALFAKMQHTNMNWARVWATYWDGKALEWSQDKTQDPKPGYLLMDAAKRWDTVFDEAARDGIYVQMTLQHHGQYTNMVDPNWVANPYNVANGGFLQKPDDFFTNEQARRLTKAKYRYIVARWGYSTHLLSYELFNEVQNIAEAHSHFQDVVDWHKEMAAYIRSIDTNHHLITTSFSPAGDPLASIGLDYNQMHSYPDDVISEFAGLKTAALTVPVFYGEWGPNNALAPEAEGDLHDGLWSGLMTPTAGAAEFWYWDGVIKNNWWHQFASLTSFVRTYNIAAFLALEPVPVNVRTNEKFGDLSFAPTGGWEPTTRTEVTVARDGSMPDVSGISSFIQGTGHRDFMPRPIDFHLQSPEPCVFTVRVGAVSGSGANMTLALDGTAVEDQALTAAPNGADTNQIVSVDVPAGSHIVSLFNTGPDWFVAKELSLSDYAPAVAVLAKGNARQALFWAYSRDRANDSQQTARLGLPSLAPGRYYIHLWNTTSAAPAKQFEAVARQGHVLTFELPPFSGDVAGVVTPATAAHQ